MSSNTQDLGRSIADDIMPVRRYEIGCIINGNRYTIGVTDDRHDAETIYRQAVNAKRNADDRVVIFVYDYERADNVSYYDSETDDI